MTNLALSDRLLQLRQRHDYTQDDIGLLTNQHREVVSDWERGKRKPSPLILATLAHVYNDDWLRGWLAARQEDE